MREEGADWSRKDTSKAAVSQRTTGYSKDLDNSMSERTKPSYWPGGHDKVAAGCRFSVTFLSALLLG